MPLDIGNIPTEFIDVDFATRPEFTFGDRGDRAFRAAPVFGDVVPDIPESEWPKLAEQMQANGGGLSQLVTRIYDQKSEGSCVANACSQAHEIKQAEQFGLDKVVHLSAISLYKRIGSSPGSGAVVGDGIEEMVSVGVLPLDNPENRAKFGDKVMPNTGFYTQYPANWKDVAVKFSGHEWHMIKTVASLITALFKSCPVVVGRSGHSICYCDPVYKNGGINVLYANSWNGWGVGAGSQPTGFGLDSLSMIRSSASWAYALRSVKDPT